MAASAVLDGKKPASQRATLCLTFDNMGRAKDIADGRASAPDTNEPGLAIGYPRLLGLLDELDLKGTFFIEGWNGLHHPDRIEDLARRGHEVGLHGWVHEKFGALDKARAEQLLHDGTAALSRIGIRPQGFRAPGGVRGPHAAAILPTLDYRYDSSSDSDVEPPQPDYFSVTPGLLAPGLAHVPWREAMVDSIQYLRHPVRPRTPAEIEASWIEAIDRTGASSGVTTVVIHAFVSGVDVARFGAVRKVLTHARRRGDLDIVTAGELASRVLA
ncbi:MAG: polysaccharide deacetylase family protein [Betaproteobacteria bacterium]